MRELLIVHLAAMLALALWLIGYVARYGAFPAGFVPLAGIVLVSTATSLGTNIGWDAGSITLCVIGGAMLLLATAQVLLARVLGRIETSRSAARWAVRPEDRGR